MDFIQNDVRAEKQEEIVKQVPQGQPHHPDEAQSKGQARDLDAVLLQDQRDKQRTKGQICRRIQQMLAQPGMF